MKKQSKKLTLNKKTISNLTALGMRKLVGGNSMTCTDSCPISKCHYCNNQTKNGKTCAGHNTCYTC